MAQTYLVPLALASLAGFSTAAEARAVETIEPAPSISAIDYDLAANQGSAVPAIRPAVRVKAQDGVIGPVPREQAAAAAAGLARPDPPLLSYEPLNRGPVLEMGALGAKRESVPGLAHIAVNWDF